MKHTFLDHFVRLFTILLVVELFGCSPAITPSATPTQPPATPSPTFTLTPSPSPTETPCLPPDTPRLDQPPEINLQPRGNLPIRATSTNAHTFTWKISGDGSLSSTTGDLIIYTAPNQSGALATVSVVASNVCGESSAITLVIQISNVIVPLDQIGIPAGFMTAGLSDPKNYVSIQQVTGDCKTGSCYKFTYTPGNVFGGILWWPPACGSSGTDAAFEAAKNDNCGISIFKQANILPVALTFWARGEKGGEIVEFKVGAGNIKPSPAASTGPIPLGLAWQQYSIPLSASMHLENATALFTWVAADLGNPAEITFYLDSIQFEAKR